MDVQNEHLKSLLDRTDLAFKALMQEPSSIERNSNYEDAKRELDSFVARLRSILAKR
ncbi:hypothetical protein OPS25_03110 [Alteromonas ponticola]|uniref:Lacal_2735 family protein n=1 Tax=Alteromonas aquimaris TaxID=2998417 RepID=A0ABT3P445_9ALTE|nr:hypothetical protein [Alteromonas aquimaris]MCW8107492.1 hypothetical protein [Alteromonas aquimaris]